MKLIPKDKITYCKQCGVPLCTTCANHCVVCGKELCDTCSQENRFKCEECYKPDEMFSVIRRSHIEQYVGCPYSLYLQLVLGIEPPMGKHAQLGIIVHEIIDQISHYDITLQQAKDELSEKIVEWNMSTDEDYSLITMELEELGVRCLENFWMIKGEFGKDFKSEYNIKFELQPGLPKISCTLDRIAFDGDKIHIHDWKTGKPMTGQKLVKDLQPPLYIYAVAQEFNAMPETFTLHYLNPNKHLTYHKIDDMKYAVKTSRNQYILDIDEALERTKEVLKSIKHNEFKMPDSSTHLWRCDKMCWFGVSGKCAGSQDEQWKKLREMYDGKKEKG